MQITTIDSEVPFGRVLYSRLYISDLKLDKLVRHDSIERHYLAWENVRKQTNPFFQTGTGFEGYLVGRCPTSEAALETILQVSQNILDAIARLYHSQYHFQAQLMRTLTREAIEPAAIPIWSGYLGSELGKLRVQMISNKEAQAFRAHTYNLVRNLPPVTYRELEEAVFQSYALQGESSSSSSNKMIVTPQSLPPGKHEAWLVAANIGEFGHPLVRQILDTR